MSGGLALLLVSLILVRLVSRRKRRALERKKSDDRVQTQGGGAIEQMRDVVGRSPDRVAELLKKWLSEEKGK